jgi:hypothetical protein
MRSRRAQRLSRGAALAAAAFATLLWAQALPLRPGNYEFVATSQIQLPPNLAAQTPPDMLAKLQQPHSYQQCISENDLQKFSKQLADKRTQNDSSCKVASQSLVGSELKFVLQCAHQTVNFAGTVSGDGFKGNLNSSTDRGQHMSASIAAHRIGDCAK